MGGDMTADAMAAHGVASEVIAGELGRVRAELVAARELLAREAPEALGKVERLEREANTLERKLVARVPWEAWSATRFAPGKAPPVRWLVPQVLPLGASAVLAAPGDAGKGMMCLNLALQVSSGRYLSGRRAPFGHPIPSGTEPRRVVILAAEDDHDSIHRRLDVLDADGVMRREAGARLSIVPLPNIGGAFALLDGDQASERWGVLVDELERAGGAGLVAVDPLASFVPNDLNDPAVGNAVTRELTRAAVRLGGVVLACHHMAKPKTDGRGRGLPTHEDARDRIRGSTAIVDGPRVSYALLPVPNAEARAVLAKLGEAGALDVGRVYWGAVVKANGEADRAPRLYVRAPGGLLEDRTSDVRENGERLEDAIKRLAAEPSKVSRLRGSTGADRAAGSAPSNGDRDRGASW